MTDDKIHLNSIMIDVSCFFAIFRLLLVKLSNKLSELREMTSYWPHENGAILLFSCLIIVASLSFVCTCMKIATQRPNMA